MGTGVVLGWLHDFGDIFMCLCRFTNALEMKEVTKGTWALLFAVFTYTRIIVFPIYTFSIYSYSSFPKIADKFQPMIWLQVVVFSGLILVHLVWLKTIVDIGKDLFGFNAWSKSNNESSSVKVTDKKDQ